MKLVLTSPRSGSYYLTQLLQATTCQSDWTHERLQGDKGLVGFPFDVVDHMGPEMGLQMLVDDAQRAGAPIVHVWRDPKDAIRSMCAKFGPSIDFFRAHFGGASLTETFTETWVQWNRLCFQAASFSCPLEEIDGAELTMIGPEGQATSTTAYRRLCAALEIEPRPEILPFRNKEHAHPAARQRTGRYDWPDPEVEVDRDELVARVVAP